MMVSLHIFLIQLMEAIMYVNFIWNRVVLGKKCTGGEKRFVNLAKQDPGRARQSS